MIDLVRIRGELRAFGRNEAIILLLEKADANQNHILPRMQEGRTVSQLPQARAAEKEGHMLCPSLSTE